jgi:amidophosphoribosyltransferase
LPCVEGVFRNRFVGRTFIQSSDARVAAARSKYTPLRSVLQNKRVFLPEDSIVRSTTLRALVGMIRHRCEPKEIHVRVACPPIVAPCFDGINLWTIEVLFASRFLDTPDERREDEMADAIGVDSLRYLPIDSVSRSIGCERESLCTGCIAGEYPTKSGQRRYSKALRDRT